MPRDLLAGTPVTITDESVILGDILLGRMGAEGGISVQFITSGAGTYKAEWLGANENVSGSFAVPYKTDGNLVDDIAATGEATGVGAPRGVAVPYTAYGAIKVTAVGEVTLTRVLLGAQN